MALALPNTGGHFFTTQKIQGGDIFVGYDRTKHNFWVITISNVYCPDSSCPDYGKGADKLWRTLVEHQAYCDRVVELLTELGNHVRLLFRLSSVPTLSSKQPNRLEDYIRDEMKSTELLYYLYERSCILYGFFKEGQWQFGVKDEGKRNGVRLELESMTTQKIVYKDAEFPL